jgi:hypothetical protein
LRRARNERGPFRGLRYSRRLGGIVSAAKAGRIDNSGWGRHMAEKRGGRAVAEKHLEMLREVAPLAWRQSAEVGRLRKRRADYERDLGYTYKGRQKRTDLWRHTNGTHYASVPLADLLEEEYVASVLRQASCTSRGDPRLHRRREGVGPSYTLPTPLARAWAAAAKS